MRLPGRGFFPLAWLFPWFGRVLVVAVCWQAAGLAWGLFAPSTLGPMPKPPRSASGPTESRDAFLGWFGVEPRAAGAPVSSDYTLMAVIAGKRGGVALLKGNDGKGVAVPTGAAVDAGNRLISVDPDSATIERDGVRQQIKFP